MSTIKAIRLHDFGGPENLKLDDIAAPTAGPGEVLVTVAASSINPIDWKIREGYARALIKGPLPAVLGGDIAGTVTAVGPDVAGLKPGDEVYAMVALTGAYAQQVAVDAAKVALKPTSASFQEAAAMPVAALTAWQALFEHGGLKNGERVLVHAGAGGVGGFAVQFAHHVGAHVIATASTENHDYLRGIGADEVVDYRTAPFETVVRDIDLVIDLIGGDTLERSYGVLRQGGRIVSASGVIDDAKLSAIGGRGHRIIVAPRGSDLKEIAALYDAGAIRATIASVYPLAEAGAAQESVKTGRTRGKVVLSIA